MPCYLAAVLFALSSVCAAVAETGAGSTPLLTKHLVDIGGRHMNLVCLGQGSPAVLFDYGLGGHLLNWEKVQPAISALTTACFYDRAGYGYSDPSGRAMTARNVTDDLYWLLHKGNVKLPVVLVGHSLGGLYATLYADRFPSEVAGLVLIDPLFSGEDLDETPEEQARAQADYDRSQMWIQACGERARANLLSVRNPAGCIPLRADQTTAERDWLAQQCANPAHWEAMLSESRSVHAPNALSEDEREEQGAAISFGDKPLIVFTAGIAPKPPDETDEEHLKNLAHWKAGHDRLAARSSHGQSILVPNATHMIQLDQPQVVIDAIRDAVLAVRAKPGSG